MDGDDESEDGVEDVQDHKEEESEEESEVEETDPEDYDVDSDDPYYEMIRQRRSKSAPPYRLGFNLILFL